ncbi:unnamed protein product [Closterium sp. Naga37s-1]|nr:unnamed protein product [Closterium sp. Naga37s-1]
MSRLSYDEQRQLPKVSVVLAVKGSIGEAGMDNWRSQLVTLYGGAVEYIFCVESEDDPAYFAVQSLQKEMKGVVDIRLVVAGLATACSQQIHNQLAGAKVACPESKYLLFLDDDIQCHPGTLGSLVKAMETRPEVFCCTGYSFDIPSTPSISAYAAMAYRLPLLIGMSSGGPAFFVWGGCIMLRLADLRADRNGMASALQRNGYSNDLILTSVAGVHGCKVWCPPTAIFPGRMSGAWTFRRYWNYVRRQIFALTTYCSSYAYRTNHVGWFFYTYASLAVTIPLIPSLIHLVLFLLSLARSVLLSSRPLLLQSGVTDVATIAALASSGLVGGGRPVVVDGRTLWWEWMVSRSFCATGLAFSLAHLASIGISALLGTRLFHAVITLCNLLSPEKPQIRLSNLSLSLGVLGMLMNLALLPVIAVYTYLQPAITWAGIKYVRRSGLVAKVRHPTPQSDALPIESRVSQKVLDLEIAGGGLIGDEFDGGCWSAPYEKRDWLVEALARVPWSKGWAENMEMLCKSLPSIRTARSVQALKVHTPVVSGVACCRLWPRKVLDGQPCARCVLLSVMCHVPVALTWAPISC